MNNKTQISSLNCLENMDRKNKLKSFEMKRCLSKDMKIYIKSYFFSNNLVHTYIYNAIVFGFLSFFSYPFE